MLGMLYISALMKLQFPSSICTTTFYISFGKITINFYLLLLASSTTHLTYLTKYVGHNVWQEIPFRKQDHKATSRYVLHGTVALLDTGCSIRKICILKIKWDPKKYPLVLENTHHKALNFSFHADLFISWMNKVVRNEKL